MCKREASCEFGNDTASVVTKQRASASFGNDAFFVRVRRRKLKGGHPLNRDWRRMRGVLAEDSASFDVVKAVRVDGKPRHEFLCGLGSVKNGDWKNACTWWIDAMYRMRRAGFDDEKKRRVIAMAIRKGAPRFSLEDIEKYEKNWNLYGEQARASFGDLKTGFIALLRAYLGGRPHD